MALNAKDLREMSVNELDKKLRDSRQELLNSRLKKKTGQLEKPHLLQELRGDIARLETILKQKRNVAA